LGLAFQRYGSYFFVIVELFNQFGKLFIANNSSVLHFGQVIFCRSPRRIRIGILQFAAELIQHLILLNKKLVNLADFPLVFSFC
jgi:demethoxyubiquinone hydroxylase (CLK1/Coq7/Cat5 family)